MFQVHVGVLSPVSLRRCAQRDVIQQKCTSATGSQASAYEQECEIMCVHGLSHVYLNGLSYFAGSSSSSKTLTALHRIHFLDRFLFIETHKSPCTNILFGQVAWDLVDRKDPRLVGCMKSVPWQSSSPSSLFCDSIKLLKDICLSKCPISHPNASPTQKRFKNFFINSHPILTKNVPLWLAGSSYHSQPFP